MRFDLHLRSQVRDQFQAIASDMQSWQAQPRIREDEVERLQGALSALQQVHRNSA
ncbi:MAG TPA: hypothetical protein IGR64_11200 [Leptolyngbyaceae cyanobacterium M65_K2018_010]|nr:hypothetical protein [Leptolyngbyaceae cyanobacterium M65_K2018_010]